MAPQVVACCLMRLDASAWGLWCGSLGPTDLPGAPTEARASARVGPSPASTVARQYCRTIVRRRLLFYAHGVVTSKYRGGQENWLDKARDFETIGVARLLEKNY